jgi:hypothetical protein
VAERYGRRVDVWLKTQETKEYITALCEISNTTEKGYLKTKRGNNGGTWLHPRLAVAFARWLDPRFGIWCDTQIDTLIRGKHPHYDWKKLRHEAASSYKVVSQILQMTRQRLGKTCAPHHFSNEARLINWALTGEFGKVDRDGLAIGDLDLLAKLENMDSVLIGCDASYDDRKQELEKFAAEQRALHVPALAAAA